MNYVVHACNEIEKVLFASLEPSAEEFGRVFTIACTALKRLGDDPDFSRALDQLEKARETNRDDFQKITELDHFVGSFLSLERDLLLKAGLSSNSVHYFLKEATSLRERIRGTSPKRAEVLNEVWDTRDDVCSIARTLTQKHEAEQNVRKMKQTIRRGIKRAGFTLGGAAMIFTNASALAASIGLSIAGSAVSGAAGTALITYGLTPGEK